MESNEQYHMDVLVVISFLRQVVTDRIEIWEDSDQYYCLALAADVKQTNAASCFKVNGTLKIFQLLNQLEVAQTSISSFPP